MKTSKSIYLILTMFITALFWGLRLFYWEITHEELFSDMADYDGIAHNIILNFAFGMNDFWKSYVTPVLPIIRAIQILFFGEDLFYWRVVQTTILFFSLIWLLKELKNIGFSLWLIITLFLVVSISKSSIFWSLKLSRESLGEAFIYLCTAASIFCFRKKTIYSFFIAGICYGISMLNRSNSALMIPIFLINICLVYYLSRRKNLESKTSFPIAVLSYLAGLMLIWSPWIARSYHVYAHPILLATQAPFIFFWDRGDVTVTLENGEKKTFTTQSLQIEAQDKFENDYQGAQYAKKMVNLWFKENWKEFPGIVYSRAINTITDSTESLTKVSRFDLLPGFYNSILIDKTPRLIICGILGLLFSVFIYGHQSAALFYCAITTWFGGAMFLSYPRMIEPAIPIMLYGNFLLVVCLIKIIIKLFPIPKSYQA